MISHRSHLIRLIVADFAARHVRRPRVFLPGRKLDRQALGELGVPPFAPLTAPDVVIHDLEKDWLLLFDAVTSGRHMNQARREQMTGHFTPAGKRLAFFSAFADRNIFSRFAESIAWETEVWIADAPDHMIHYNGLRFLGPYPDDKTADA